MKLRFLRFTFIMLDYRDHRKIAFHRKLLKQNWNDIYKFEDIDSVISCLNCLNNLKVKIGQIIGDNRKALAGGKLGSRGWWKKVDQLSQRKDKVCQNLDKQFLQSLNDYSNNLCYDEDCIQRLPVWIDECEVNYSVPSVTLA